MGLFRKAPSPHQTALAMIGARPGDRVLLAGRPEPIVVAELARITGLTGETLLAVAPAAKPPYDAAAGEAGTLVEIAEAPDDARLPATAGPHDVAVLHFDLATLDDASRQLLAGDAFSAVRPGGRVVIIEGRRPGRWFSGHTAALPADAVIALLEGAGGLAARHIGGEDGLSYFEARKTR